MFRKERRKVLFASPKSDAANIVNFYLRELAFERPTLEQTRQEVEIIKHVFFRDVLKIRDEKEKRYRDVLGEPHIIQARQGVRRRQL